MQMHSLQQMLAFASAALTFWEAAAQRILRESQTGQILPAAAPVVGNCPSQGIMVKKNSLQPCKFAMVSPCCRKNPMVQLQLVLTAVGSVECIGSI